MEASQLPHALLNNAATLWWDERKWYQAMDEVPTTDHPDFRLLGCLCE
jgi:hypothetical protein